VREQVVPRSLDERAQRPPRENARAVLDVRAQHLVVGTQPERARRDVHARGRVLDEGEVVAVRTDEGAELCPRVRELRPEPTHDEVHRVALQLPLPLLVAVEDGPRGGPEGAVVEERDLGIDEEALFQCRPTPTVP